MESLIGNVYRNDATGNQWKIIKIKGDKITFEDMQGNRFDTLVQLTGNYTYIGTRFTKTKNF